MKRRSFVVFGQGRARAVAACTVMFVGSAIAASAMLFACSGSQTSPFAQGSGNNGNNGNNGNGDGSVGLLGDGGVPIFVVGDDSAAPITFTDGGCAGLQCQISDTCTNDGGTTIVGKVMDPAGANPLYNVLVYVPMFDPAVPSKIPAGYGIQPITGGVEFPSGVTCDSCSYLYTGNPIAVGTTGTDGTFTITNAPSGTNIPVVVQVGKWRTHATVANVTSCGQADAGAINMPGSVPAADPSSASRNRHLDGRRGLARVPPLPHGDQRLGVHQRRQHVGAHSRVHGRRRRRGSSRGLRRRAPRTCGTRSPSLEKYDVSLFSCEGSETTDANPQLLQQYVNAGGRAFLSHYHYAWLAGPLQGGGSYTANPDWGSNLASWNSNDQGADQGAIIGAKISTTLNVGGGTFTKGVDLESWLSNVGALGTSGVASTEVAINSPSFDPNVTSSNTISQAWATYDTTTATDDGFPTAYFSFNTPVTAVAPPTAERRRTAVASSTAVSTSERPRATARGARRSPPRPTAIRVLASSRRRRRSSSSCSSTSRRA